MEEKRTNRGFQYIEHEVYADETGKKSSLVAQSSIIGDYDDAYERPGTSALWIGKDHHLNRAEVKQLVKHLQSWLRFGTLHLTDHE